MEKFFKLKENGTNTKTELLAGLTTFMTMAYILTVNPDILKASGMDPQAILIATALSAFLGTLFMALLANYPFALAPGLGLNAYFAYTVCGDMGYSWKVALFAVFIEGIIFIVLSLTNVREAIFDAIPTNLKTAVSVGIGLFVAFIGLQDAKLVVDGSTLVTLRSFGERTPETVGAVLAIIGVLITSLLMIRGVKGNILLGIVITWILGIMCELSNIYIPNPEAGMYSVIPSKFISLDFSALSQTFAGCFDGDTLGSIKIFDFIVIMFSFLFVDLFDTLGTLIGVSAKADMLDENGKLPKIRGALLADAMATTVGAVLGTSTTTTFVESAAGVTAGGRTGLTAIVTALLFLLSTIFSPLFLTIPSFAIAPALIVVGFFMMGNVTKLDFSDVSEAIPCFLCMVVMPLTYSISDGIAAGIISWTVLNVFSGNTKGKKISVLMYVLTVLFVLKYILL